MMLRSSRKGLIVAMVLLAGWAIVSVGCHRADDSLGPVSSISIAELRAMYRGYPQRITTACSVEGVVVSSDERGEHHNQLFLQDATGGIAVSINHDRIHIDFPLGSIVSLRIAGLTLGGYGGEPTLGDTPSGGYEFTALDWDHWQSIASVCGVADRVEVERVRISEIEPRHCSTLVVVEDVGFVEAGEQWAEEGDYSLRHLVDRLFDSDTLQVRTSGYSDFWWHKIPTGTGSVAGILSFFGDHYQLVVSSPASHNLTNEQK